jgi:hypothetical protein
VKLEVPADLTGELSSALQEIKKAGADSFTLELKKAG